MSKWLKIKQEYLHSILEYDQYSGIFIWKEARGNVTIGTIAGNKRANGYVYIFIDGKYYEAHRLAWIYINGNFTEVKTVIDHIDGNPNNNAISNLRLVSRGDNQRNKRKHKNNTSGVVGVTWNKARKKWIAQLTIDSTPIYLGGFEKFSEAVDARKNAEVLYGFHENHGREI